MNKLSLIIVVLVLAFSSVLAGCGGGISQADYDKVNAQLQSALASVTQTLVEKDNALEDLQKAQISLGSMEKQTAALELQLAELNTTGATTLETVAKMARAYEQSHYYIRDVYDCNNYAADFWNMLKKAGINTDANPTVIVVGDKDQQITDILQSNHAWVMVDLGNGEKVAVDPTGGMVITQAENPNYYRGWTYGTPADLKANDDLRAGYNARVNVYNALVAEINEAQAQYNTTFSPSDLAVYNKLKEIQADHQTMLIQLKAQIDSFATRL